MTTKVPAKRGAEQRIDAMRTRRHRLSIWKRAVLHGLKTLVRKHPGAALHSAGAAVSYVGREGLLEGAEFVKAKMDDVSHVIGAPGGAHAAPVGRRDDTGSQALIEKLSVEERQALARLARE